MRTPLRLLAAASLATSLATSLAAVTPAAAHDEPVGVGACSATAPSPHGRGSCTLVANPGVYTITLTSGARYSSANVFCNEQLPVYALATAGLATLPTPYLSVTRWDTDPQNATASGRLPSGNCVLQVAAGAFSPTYGTGGAHAHVFRTAP